VTLLTVAEDYLGLVDTCTLESEFDLVFAWRFPGGALVAGGRGAPDEGLTGLASGFAAAELEPADAGGFSTSTKSRFKSILTG
jgi:hypothetical protein